MDAKHENLPAGCNKHFSKVIQSLGFFLKIGRGARDLA